MVTLCMFKLQALQEGMGVLPPLYTSFPPFYNSKIYNFRIPLFIILNMELYSQNHCVQKLTFSPHTTAQHRHYVFFWQGDPVLSKYYYFSAPLHKI